MELDITRSASNFLIRDRSDYQLHNFVIGQFDTPEMQYRQILIEARSLIFRIKNSELEIQIIKLEIADLLESGMEIDQLRARKKELELTQIVDSIVAAKKELDYLSNLLIHYPQYTPEDIEANQEEYWQKRLSRQAQMDRMAAVEGVRPDNLEALRNAKLMNLEIS